MNYEQSFVGSSNNSELPTTNRSLLADVPCTCVLFKYELFQQKILRCSKSSTEEQLSKSPGMWGVWWLQECTVQCNFVPHSAASKRIPSAVTLSSCRFATRCCVVSYYVSCVLGNRLPLRRNQTYAWSWYKHGLSDEIWQYTSFSAVIARSSFISKYIKPLRSLFHVTHVQIRVECTVEHVKNIWQIYAPHQCTQSPRARSGSKPLSRKHNITTNIL